MTDEMKIIASPPPMHPGEMLREEFLEPVGLSAGRVTEAFGVPRTRIERIAREELGIFGDTAVRRGKFFKTSPEFWMNPKTRYEVVVAQRTAADALASIESCEPRAARATEPG